MSVQTEPLQYDPASQAELEVQDSPSAFPTHLLLVQVPDAQSELLQQVIPWAKAPSPVH
jgi:hypothetical protein